MHRLKRIVEQTDTPAGRAFDLFIQAVILVSIVCFSIETLPGISDKTRGVLNMLELFAVGIFTAEYLLRLVVADKWWRFVFSFYGLIDLAAILPFYLTLGIDLRGVRAVRFFRLFQMFKLLRYSKAVRLYTAAFKEIREELALFLAAAAIMVFITSVGIYYCESAEQPEVFGSIFHCMWWAIVTMTTVGYGDAYPVTLAGKVFTGVVLMIGLGVVAVPTGLFASALTNAKQKANDRPNEV